MLIFNDTVWKWIFKKRIDTLVCALENDDSELWITPYRNG